MTGTVDGRSQVRKYRGSLVLKALVAALLFVCASALAAFAVLLVRVAQAPFVVALPFAAFAALTLAFMMSFIRVATILDQDHITVRDAGARRTAWRDVTAIEIEETSIGAGNGAAKTVDSVVIYTHDGRRIVLPNLVGKDTQSTQHEVHALREMWEQRRGKDWTPQPAVIKVAQEKSAARDRLEGSIIGAMGCAYTAMRITVFGVVVVSLIALATGKADDLPEFGWMFAAVLGGVAVVLLLIVRLTGPTRDRTR